MSHRREAYAARFLRPPGFLKRVMMREKPRDLTGPFENPVRRFVRLREKAREFCQLPPPRRVPVPKPPPKKLLGPVPNVPKVRPEVLQRRLEFLLSDKAVAQQNAEPMVMGSHPYQVERRAWERQMRDLRKIYRAQYLQKLAEITAIEREKQKQLLYTERAERERRRQEHLDKLGEERKRQAILKDRLRIESKVTEAIEMARRSKIKRRRLFWVRRFEGFADYITRENVDIDIPSLPSDLANMASSSTMRMRDHVGDGATSSSSDSTTRTGGARAHDKGFTRARQRGGKMTAEEWKQNTMRKTSVSADKQLPESLSGAKLFSRNVSIPFILRQMGCATTYPQQKNRRVRFVDNVERELRESSYAVLGEDEPQFSSASDSSNAQKKGMDPWERAQIEYSTENFTEDEKRRMLDDKIEMLKELKEKVNIESQQGKTDETVMHMIDNLETQLLATKEEHVKKTLAEEGKKLKDD